jgi:hypothetical protein
VLFIAPFALVVNVITSSFIVSPAENSLNVLSTFTLSLFAAKSTFAITATVSDVAP